MEPPQGYIQEMSGSVVHHSDYPNGRDDHALCGAALGDANLLTHTSQSDVICPDCEAKLVIYHLEWWRGQALALAAELDVLRAKYGEPEAVRPEPVPAHDPMAELDQDPPTTLLDRARRELTALCQQFDGAIPFFRLKNAMQDFNDRLDTEERVLLAEEIGAHGSLIRWSTTEVEALGLEVKNNLVREQTEATWESWVQDSYQTPKKTKRRLGRRS